MCYHGLKWILILSFHFRIRLFIQQPCTSNHICNRRPLPGFYIHYCFLSINWGPYLWKTSCYKHRVQLWSVLGLDIWHSKHSTKWTDNRWWSTSRAYTGDKQNYSTHNSDSDCGYFTWS